MVDTCCELLPTLHFANTPWLPSPLLLIRQYKVNYSMIDNYYAAIQKDGFHALSYFDVGNWGT
jgi:hypothetical protein